MISVLAYLAGVLVFLVGIGLSIGLHEIGHMWPAKAFGARVSRYMIGFGPTLWSRKTKETEYGIKLLPLGGYVAISGMFPPRPQQENSSAGEAVAGASSKKIKVDGWLREWVEQARKQQFDQDGSYDPSRAFYRLSIPKRIIIMMGGPAMNLVLGSVLMFGAMVGIGGYQAGNQIKHVFDCVYATYDQTACNPGDAASPAKAAGLRAGDRVVEVNGQAVTVWDSVAKQLAAHPSNVLHLKVQRDSKLVKVDLHPVVKLRPVIDDLTNQAVTNKDGSLKLVPRGLIGIQLDYSRAPLSAEFSFRYMGYTLGQTFAMIADLPHQLWNLAQSTFTGGKRSESGPVSIIGVGNISGSIGDNSQLDLAGKISSWMMILGSLNYALFVFNLLPLLPLDGGHVLSAIFEAVRNLWYRLRRKAIPGPLDTARFVPFTMVMWGILMVMSVLVILADLIHPVSLG